MFRVHANGPSQLAACVYKLIEENLSIFDSQKYAVDLLDTPIRYKREAPGQNEFLNIRDMIARGFGDCEDLAAALIAYYLFCGYKARPVLTQTGPRMWHVTLEVWDDNQWVQIDPSRMKGMN